MYPADKVTVIVEEPTMMETTVIGVVDAIKETFSELVAFTKSIGPDVWEIMVRQQFAEAISISIALLLALTIMVLSYRVLVERPEWAKDKNECNVGGWIFSIVSTIGSVVLIKVFLTHALPRFINPAYYALMELAKLKP